jgi:hypothetical protein
MTLRLMTEKPELSKTTIVQEMAITIKKLYSVALVRKRTIPTERPPLVDEVSAKLLRVKGVAWSAQRIPTAVNLAFLDRSNHNSDEILHNSRFLCNRFQRCNYFADSRSQLLIT